ncbi:CPLN1 protein, partial [Chloropsis cyanopogon]|nr:CPLN1 protein [Chloropsis cyanopogon]
EFQETEMKSGRMLQCYGWPVFSSAAECRVSRSSRQKPPQVATAVQTESDLDSDRDVVSPWTVPDDIQRILQDTHDSMFQQASAVHSRSFSPLSGVNLDSVSGSTGSILSKLDWNAVEAMVADVEDE